MLFRCCSNDECVSSVRIKGRTKKDSRRRAERSESLKRQLRSGTGVDRGSLGDESGIQFNSRAAIDGAGEKAFRNEKVMEWRSNQEAGYLEAE